MRRGSAPRSRCEPAASRQSTARRQPDSCSQAPSRQSRAVPPRATSGPRRPRPPPLRGRQAPRAQPRRQLLSPLPSPCCSAAIPTASSPLLLLSWTASCRSGVETRAEVADYGLSEEFWRTRRIGRPGRRIGRPARRPSGASWRLSALAGRARRPSPRRTSRVGARPASAAPRGRRRRRRDGRWRSPCPSRSSCSRARHRG